jgi:hypothetical protein
MGVTFSLMQRIRLAARVLLSGRLPTNRRTDIPPINAEEVAEARLFFPMDKFFIYGHARSGTTLLARLMRVHPEVHCNYQAHFFTRSPLLQSLVADPEVGAWLSRRSNRWNRGRDLSPVVLRAACDFIMERDARRQGKRIVGDKSPNSLLDGEAVRLLYNVYPDARLFYIVRDGRDTAISHRFQSFVENPQALPKEDQLIRQAFSQDPQPFLRGERSIFTEKGLRQAAEGWVKNVSETDQRGKELFGTAYISVRYEDLLERPTQEMCRLWAFMGVETFPDDAEGRAKLDQAVLAETQQNPDADWQQQKANEIASPLQKGRQGTWREMFTASDRHIFDQVAGETLANWGYSSA